MIKGIRVGMRNSAFPDIAIREASDRDLKDMFRLERMCFDIEAFSVQQLRYLVNTRTSIALVAECDGQFAGFTIGLTNRNRSGKYGRVYTLDVDEAYRRKGVASTLMDSLMNGFEDTNCSRCFLEVKIDNDKAIALYEKMGFEKLHPIFNYYSIGVHALKMRKPLHPRLSL
jgi:ribosomal-protein-alanine N-acetyltransferase